MRGRTLFLPKDRLYLTKVIVDEVFDFGVLREQGLIESFVALHDANYGETPTTDWLQKRWVYFWNAEADRAGAPYLSHYAMLRGRRCPCYLRPWAQPLAEIRSYYGEKVALYFAWLSFYGYYLMLPACFCLAAQLSGAARDRGSDEYRGDAAAATRVFLRGIRGGAAAATRGSAPRNPRQRRGRDAG